MKETKQPFTLSERIDLLTASQETLLGILKDTLQFPGVIRSEMRTRFREAEATLMNAKSLLKCPTLFEHLMEQNCDDKEDPANPTPYQTNLLKEIGEAKALLGRTFQHAGTEFTTCEYLVAFPSSERMNNYANEATRDELREKGFCLVIFAVGKNNKELTSTLAEIKKHVACGQNKEPQWKAEIVANEARLEDSVILEEFEKYMFRNKEEPSEGLNYLFAIPLSGIEGYSTKLLNGKFSPNVILNIT